MFNKDAGTEWPPALLSLTTLSWTLCASLQTTTREYKRYTLLGGKQGNLWFEVLFWCTCTQSCQESFSFPKARTNSGAYRGLRPIGSQATYLECLQRYPLHTCSPMAPSPSRLLLSCLMLLLPAHSAPGSPHAVVCDIDPILLLVCYTLRPGSMGRALATGTQSIDISNLRFCLRSKASLSGTHQRLMLITFLSIFFSTSAWGCIFW